MISSTIKTNVPCSFSKTGFHTLEIAVDAEYNVQYFQTTCSISKDKDAIQGLRELGAQCCLVQLEDIRDVLAGTVGGDWTKFTNIKQAQNHFAEGFVRYVHNKVLTTKRMRAERNHTPDKTRYERVLETTAAKIFRSAILPSENTVEVDSFFPKKDLPTAFRIHNKYYGHELTLNGMTVARRESKVWNVDIDSTKSIASRILTPDYEDRDALDARTNFCVFCQKQLTRPSKHLSGAQHLSRVTDIVKLVCKGLSPQGIRLINNPKHRSVFFR